MISEKIELPWGQKEKDHWFNEQVIKRSYQLEVVTKISNLKDKYEVLQYGALSINPEKYPLFIVKSKNLNPTYPTILITGGVHGYETSGVHGSLLFMEKYATSYFNQFNFICAPCISPWAYETINRWNNLAIDPNRSFYQDSPAEECKLFLNAIAAFEINLLAHFDLHETTDTDNTIFRIALEKRDGIKKEFSEIPDGFYVVGDTLNPQSEFQKAIINSVRKITHIAPADKNGKLIGEAIESEGVVNYNAKKLFLCSGFSDAKYTTTTEVYPDSPKVTNEICNEAQAAAVYGGLDYIKKLM